MWETVQFLTASKNREVLQGVFSPSSLHVIETRNHTPSTETNPSDIRAARRIGTAERFAGQLARHPLATVNVHALLFSAIFAPAFTVLVEYSNRVHQTLLTSRADAELVVQHVPQTIISTSERDTIKRTKSGHPLPESRSPLSLRDSCSLRTLSTY